MLCFCDSCPAWRVRPGGGGRAPPKHPLWSAWGERVYHEPAEGKHPSVRTAVVPGLPRAAGIGPRSLRSLEHASRWSSFFIPGLDKSERPPFALIANFGE